MNSAGGPPLGTRRIDKVTIKEFPSCFRIDVPRQFASSVGIFLLFGVLSLGWLLLAQTPQKRHDGIIFYMSLATIAFVFRLTMRNVITVTDSRIDVSHRNFGLSWWKSHHRFDQNCQLKWVPAWRRAPSALELSCGERTARFGFEITEEEASQVLELLTQRFPNLHRSSDIPAHSEEGKQ